MRGRMPSRAEGALESARRASERRPEDGVSGKASDGRRPGTGTTARVREEGAGNPGAPVPGLRGMSTCRRPRGAGTGVNVVTGTSPGMRNAEGVATPWRG